ncbi:sensor histidine kinase [Gracilimonas sediminicola]|uniref:histidine kinase n=1 Tax=Gracilimonas sediminicola TaxID=2952158 RepID=A0A9X2L3K8_9BACT|nr:ATP-binding protein [Gracilimonas sediminicola]MCP9291634.1 ATP-binding protein [Gracilimonas sediminicola]
MEELEFRISSGLKDIIGKDLITDDYIAVFELVKNSFDAYATEVTVRFENIEDGNGKITIIDNGKGMNYDDLLNKWLFVAYSAKKEGTEDENYDYRDRISDNNFFAGAKGIGRFSCDKLGSELMLETTKQEKNPKTEVLITNWEKFEENSQEEFINVSVLHETKDQNSFGLDHGTVLVIENLRSNWDRDKYLKLKDSLAKLINPKEARGDQKFKITLEVPEEEERDKDYDDYYEIVNGEIKNFIFETLELKTSKIRSRIIDDGTKIETELFDGGSLIYRIIEENKFTRLDNIACNLYYLNRSAKYTFTSKMGVQSVNYGHVFLYKNGFRVYPYGEPGEDPFKVDVRKAQGYKRFLGNRELMGSIEVYSESEEIKETSSRGDGLKKTDTYEELEEFFWLNLRRLEKYVVEVQKWGLSIEDEEINDLDFKSRVTDLIARLTSSDEIINFHVPDNFLEILEVSQEGSAESVVKNLNKIAFESGDESLIEQAEKASSKLEEIQEARREAEKQADKEKKKAEEATKKLRDQISENLFLKSINTSEYEEVISLLHHVGIYAGTIDNNLKGISLRIQNDIELSSSELKDIIRLISFETKKILNVVAFATKANFKLKTETIEVDLNNYIQEYISNIIPTVTDKTLNIKIDSKTSDQFKKKLKPIELNIVIDNIVSNAKKADADNLTVSIDKKESNLVIKFIDDGTGIDKSIINQIYNQGFTTTDGSGIGLYHVKQIINDMKGTISATNNPDSGACFTLTFK